MKRMHSSQVLAAFLDEGSIHQKVLGFLQILLASCFIGICAQIEIPLYFTPVPLTIQSMAVMLVGMFLGAQRGACAVVCYLLQGCLGLPVWAGGSSGLGILIGPTGGYLLAFIAQGYFIGRFINGEARTFKMAGILFLSILFQLMIGALWLAQFVGFKCCLQLGFYPFIAIEMTKAYLVAAASSSYNSLRKRKSFFA